MNCRSDDEVGCRFELVSMTHAALDVRQLTPSDFAANAESLARGFSTLMSDLRGKPQEVTAGRVLEVLSQPGTTLFVGYHDRKLVATFTAVVCSMLTRKALIIEDVVVEEGSRGQGFGDQLVDFAKLWARKNGVDTIELTSRPERAAANQLYLKHGFEVRDTNVFRYRLASPQTME